MDDPFKLRFEDNCDLHVPPVLFAGKTDEAKCASCWTPFVGACTRMTLQLQVCGWLRFA